MKWIARIAFALLVVLAAVVVASYALLLGSLPRLDGTVEARAGSGAQLRAPVTIERDALGIPTVRGASRADVAYGTGFLHAQERFFQMDLSRRLAGAGLAELFGEAAAGHDASVRPFRFRELAREVLRSASPDEREIAAAYARGVNAGLESLRSRPWEYWLLQRRPGEWRDEDTLLVVYAMWWDLQYEDWKREIVLRTVDAKLGGPVCASGWKCATEFFYPLRTEWDAPNGPSAPPAPFAMLAGVPPPEALDLRGKPAPEVSAAMRTPERGDPIGSNNWAVAGRFTANRSALVASDMHLTLRVPATWYRARLIVAAGDHSELELNGVTLPGAPALVAGSNGDIAWAYTNSYGDWQDVARHPCDAAEAGVRVAPAQAGQCWFVRWLAQAPGATNLGMLSFERARSVG
ncbi:MAG TPA: penicillin acylase family protein, partial [Steroidobacteraceae bacterium]|nr:penicillin acylase family protein [Steroidobacteraceae bacterium]